MARYYKGLDLSNEIQTMYEIILKVTDLKTQEQLRIQLSNINHALDVKGDIIKKVIKSLDDL